MDTTDPDIYRQANEVYGRLRREFLTPHSYREVELSAFKRLNHRFYEDTQRVLEKHGFKPIADVEDETSSIISPEHQIVYRFFVHIDKAITAACSHNRARGFKRFILFANRMTTDSYAVEFETEFSDGTFVCTLHTSKEGYDPEPGIVETRLDAATPLEKVVQAHSETVDRHLALRPGVAPIPIETLQDSIHSQERIQQLRRGFRRSIGFMTEDEFLRLYWPHRQEEGRIVFEKMRQIHEHMDATWDNPY